MNIAAEMNKTNYSRTYWACNLAASEARRYVSGEAKLKDIGDTIIDLADSMNRMREFADAAGAVMDMTTIRLAAGELLSIAAVHDGLPQKAIISDSAYYWAE